MKKILLHMDSRDPLDDSMFKTGDINRMNDVWVLLKNKLLELGYEIHTADSNNLNDCAGVLFMDSVTVNYKYIREEKMKSSLRNNIEERIKILLRGEKKLKRDLFKECINKNLSDKIALFMWEGRSVDPGNYSSKLHDKFNLIFTWDDKMVDNKKFIKFYLPIPNRQPIDNPVSFADKKMLVLINHDKISKIPGELNSERRKAALFFGKKLLNQFDLFGNKWNRPKNKIQTTLPFLVKKYSNYRGVAADKILTLSKYKFCICYENLSGEKGYITEKIFDCFQAKTVPIYWGAENIEDYVDKNTFIDRRRFKNNHELLKFILNIKEEEYKKYINAINNYLKSDKYKLFLPENFVNTIIKNIKNKLCLF